MDFHNESVASPFKTVWLHPRDTVRAIVAENPKLHVLLLVCLAGIGKTLNGRSMRDAGDKLPVWAIFAIALVIGPLGGLLGLWIYSHLLRWTGNWLGGVAPRAYLRTAIAWSAVPIVCSLLLWIPELLLIGTDIFTRETPRLDAHPLLWIPFIVLSGGETILGIWSFVISCQMVAEVQGFRSAWRGLGNIFLSGAVVVIPFFLILLGVALCFR